MPQPDLAMIDEMLADLPMTDRLAMLTSSLIGGADATAAAQNLIEVAVVMTRRLPSEERAAIAYELRQASYELAVRWQ